MKCDVYTVVCRNDVNSLLSSRMTLCAFRGIHRRLWHAKVRHGVAQCDKSNAVLLRPTFQILRAHVATRSVGA